MACQKENYNSKKASSKIFSTKPQEYSPFSENNKAFYSIADISFHFTTVSERKVPFLRRKIQRFAVLE